MRFGKSSAAIAALPWSRAAFLWFCICCFRSFRTGARLSGAGGDAEGCGDAQAVRRAVEIRRADGGDAHGKHHDRTPGHPGALVG